MLKWLRKKLRSWLLEDERKVDTVECLINGKITRAAVEGVCGMNLMVSTGQDCYLIGADRAVNKRDFWSAWSQRNTEDYVWEDGEKFEPNKEC